VRAAYGFLLEQPPLGLAVQRHGEEFVLVTAPEVGTSIERHLGHPREVALSRAALEVLAIVAYSQPIARAGIELIRGSSFAFCQLNLDLRIERDGEGVLVLMAAAGGLSSARNLEL
jgi:putative transcriptional regulator (Ypuh-like)